MTLLFMLRHGHTDWADKKLAGWLPDVHLNELGVKQAEALVERLAPIKFDAIYSSPLERALETAEPLATALGLDVIPRPGLIETDVGEWQGKTIKGLSRLKIWRKVLGAPSLMRFPGGESFIESQYRICQEIEWIREQHDPKVLIACFSHADPIKLAIAYYLGMPLDMFQRLTVSPASITALQLGEGGSHLLTLNYDFSLNFAEP